MRLRRGGRSFRCDVRVDELSFFAFDACKMGLSGWSLGAVGAWPRDARVGKEVFCCAKGLAKVHVEA